MRKIHIFSVLLLTFFLFSNALLAQNQDSIKQAKAREAGLKVDPRIDNMRYWRMMAEYGFVDVAPQIEVEQAFFTGTAIEAQTVITEDSPDVPVTDLPSTQSENSIFINPNDPQNALNSNNSTSVSASTLYGANDLFTFDGGETWQGELEGAGGANSGDPAVAISNDGRYYAGYIHSNGGQGVSYSTDQGQTWTPVVVANSPGGWGGLLDKNHLWIDNSLASPYDGNLYNAWTPFGGGNDSEIEISRSTDGGVSWSTPIAISTAVNAGSHNQGVNISTGPDGEVYAVWAIYDGFPADENALGFARSFDGGATFEPATRIISNIRGIRTTETSKNMRVNSFPTMAVDISGGANNGTIYITWANIGTPGVNNGPEIDVYMIKSTDQGETWSDPIRVNQDTPGQGKEHYFPWIACDQINGNLSVIFYDDRNVASNQCEVFVANSIDGGETWEDFKVSDVAFTPAPIAGLADGYMGDYLGIAAHDRMVYPVWPDNRSGTIMSYCSPFVTGPPPNQPWVIYSNHDLNDVSGNENGQLDNGEAVKLSVAMHNIGDQPATDVQVTISTESEYVTLIDDNEMFGDFEVDQETYMEDAFSFMAAPNTPDNQKIVFDVVSTDGDSTWYSKLSVNCHAPHLAIGDAVVDDSNGNNNGILDPGETATIEILTINDGNGTATSAVGKLLSSNEYITIINSEHEFGVINGGDSETALFEVEVSTNAPSSAFAEFIYEVSTLHQSDYELMFFAIGDISAMEDFETGDFSLFDWTSGITTPWTIDTEAPYEETYCARSGAITDNQETQLAVTLNILYPGVVSFYKKVSSENNYDYLRFLIDGEEVGSWSGEVAWSEESYPVSAGEHTFAWVYEKDYIVSGGDDCAWVDFINFPATLPPGTDLSVGAVAFDEEVCDGSETQLHAVATGGSGEYEYTWSPATGLNSAVIPNPIASPEEATTYTVTVTDGENEVTAEVEVGVKDGTTVEIGDNQHVNPGDELVLDAGEGYASYLWSDGSTEQTITVNGNDVFDPFSIYWVQVEAENGCRASDDVSVFLWQTGIGNNDNSTAALSITPNPTDGEFTLTASNLQGENMTIEVFDLQGKMVFQTEKAIAADGSLTQYFDLKNQPKSLYFIKLHNDFVNKTIKIAVQ